MAKGKKTGGKNFENGNPGGPGRPKVPQEVTKAREFLKNAAETLSHDLVQIAMELLYRPISELHQITSPDSKESSLKAVISSTIITIRNRGDFRTFNELLNRVIGPVYSQVALTDPAESDRPLAQLPAQDLKEALQIVKALKKEKEWTLTQKLQQSSELLAASLAPEPLTE